MLRFAICDDENEIRTALRERIRTILESLDVRAELFSYADSVTLLAKHAKLHFEAVFLDIEMEWLGFLVIFATVCFCGVFAFQIRITEDVLVESEMFLCTVLCLAS